MLGLEMNQRLGVATVWSCGCGHSFMCWTEDGHNVHVP